MKLKKLSYTTGFSTEFEVNLKERLFFFFGEYHDFFLKIGKNGDEIEVKNFFFWRTPRFLGKN